MFVGVLRIELSLPHNDSLKGKRAAVRRVLDRVAARYNAAVAEVDALDEHRRAVLGFAVLSNDGRHANAMLDEIADFAEASSEVPVSRRAVTVTPIAVEASAAPDDVGGLTRSWAELEEA